MATRRVAWAGVAVLLLMAGVAWWLLRSHEAAEQGAGLLVARPAERSAGGLPEPVVADVVATPAEALVPAEPAAPTSRAPSAPQALTITGRVLDALGRPLPGAGVLLVADRNDAWHKHWAFLRDGPDAVSTHVRTGSDGRFVLGADALPEAATPRLVVHHDTAATLVRPCAGLRAGSLDVGDMRLEPGAAVRGRVLDVARAPLAEVHVTFSDLPGGAEPREDDEVRLYFCAGRSGADGRFRASGLRVAPATLRAEYRTPQVWLRPRVLRDLPLSPGPPLDVGDIVLDEGGVIAGSVRDDTGAPVAGASVSAAKHGDWQEFDESEGLWRTSARTDAQGAFRLTGLQPGSYDLDVLTGEGSPAAADLVALGTLDLNLVAPRPGSVLVRLTDESGAPVEGASLAVTLPARHKVRAWSDWQFKVAAGAAAGLDPGLYRISGAGPQGAEIEVRAPGHVPSVVEAPGVAPAEEVVVPLTLLRAMALTGRVRDDADASVAGASVVLQREASDLTLSARSGADGAFRVDGLAPGTWRLRATAAGHARADALLDVTEGRAPAPLQVTLVRHGSVDGLVTRAGAPLAGARVHAVARPAAATDAGTLQDALRSGDLHEPRRLRTADADGQGRFRLEDVPAGPVLLWIERGADARWALAWGLREQADAALFRVEVEPGAATEAVLALPAPAELRGRVLGGGAGLAGAPVVLSPAGLTGPGDWPFAARETATEAGGNFTFADVPPGAWIIVAQPRGGLLPLAQALELLPGELRHVELAAQGHDLEGLVVDATDGAPLEGAVVRFDLDAEPEAGEAVRRWGRNSLGVATSLSEAMRDAVTTGADGRFVVRWLPTGRQRLMTGRAGYLEDDRFVALAPSLESRPVRIELLRGAGVVGEIRGGGLAPRQYAVSCGPPDQPRWRWAEVDGLHFSIDGLAAGDWVLTVHAYPDLQQALGVRNVRLAPGQVMDLVLQLDG